jgi:hypothetical protein
MDELLRINCERHHNYFITHGCSSMDCHKEVLFCSGCFLENLEHASEHKEHIVPLERFLLSFYQSLSGLNERIEPYHILGSQRQSHIQHYEEFLSQQNYLIESELQEISNHVNLFLNKIKSKYMQDLRNLKEELEEFYSSLEECFRSTEITFLDIRDQEEFYQNITEFTTPAQITAYLTNLRGVMQTLRDPIQSGTMKKLAKTSHMIQAFYKNPDSSIMPLLQAAQPHLKALYSEVDSKVSQFVRQIGQPIDEALAFAENRESHQGSASKPMELLKNDKRPAAGGPIVRSGPTPLQTSPITGNSNKPNIPLSFSSQNILPDTRRGLANKENYSQLARTNPAKNKIVEGPIEQEKQSVDRNLMLIFDKEEQSSSSRYHDPPSSKLAKPEKTHSRNTSGFLNQKSPPNEVNPMDVTNKVGSRSNQGASKYLSPEFDMSISSERIDPRPIFSDQYGFADRPDNFKEVLIFLYINI